MAPKLGVCDLKKERTTEELKDVLGKLSAAEEEQCPLLRAWQERADEMLPEELPQQQQQEQQQHTLLRASGSSAPFFESREDFSFKRNDVNWVPLPFPVTTADWYKCLQMAEERAWLKTSEGEEAAWGKAMEAEEGEEEIKEDLDELVKKEEDVEAASDFDPLDYDGLLLDRVERLPVCDHLHDGQTPKRQRTETFWEIEVTPEKLIAPPEERLVASSRLCK